MSWDWLSDWVAKIRKPNAIISWRPPAALGSAERLYIRQRLAKGAKLLLQNGAIGSLFALTLGGVSYYFTPEITIPWDKFVLEVLGLLSGVFLVAVGLVFIPLSSRYALTGQGVQRSTNKITPWGEFRSFTTAPNLLCREYLDLVLARADRMPVWRFPLPGDGTDDAILAVVAAYLPRLSTDALDEMREPWRPVVESKRFGFWLYVSMLVYTVVAGYCFALLHAAGWTNGYVLLAAAFFLSPGTFAGLYLRYYDVPTPLWKSLTFAVNLPLSMLTLLYTLLFRIYISVGST